MNPGLGFLAVIFLVTLVPGVGAAGELSGTEAKEELVLEAVTLDSLLTEALSRNPGVQAKKSAYQAARARVFGNFLPPDPEFGLDVEGQPNLFDFGQRVDNEYMLQQRFLFPTKLLFKGLAAAREAQALYYQYKEEERDAAWHIEQPYYELVLAKKTIEALEESKGFMEQALQAVTRRYESGRAPQDDLLKAQIELAKISIEIFDWKEKESISQAHFSHILNRKLHTRYVLAAGAPGARREISRDRLGEMALERRPELQAVSMMIRRARMNKWLLRQDWLPDIMLRYEGRQYKDRAPITEHDTFLGFTVPFWSLLRQAGGDWKAAGLEMAALEHEYSRMKNEVLLKVHEGYSGFQSAGNALSVYENSILPKTKQIVDLSLSAYEAGKGDFLAVLDAERELKSARVEYCRSQAAYEAALSNLRLAVGVNLEEAAA